MVLPGRPGLTSLARSDETVHLVAFVVNVHPLVGERPCTIMITDLRLSYLWHNHDLDGVISIPHALITTAAFSKKWTTATFGVLAGGEWYIFTGPKKQMAGIEGMVASFRGQPLPNLGHTTPLTAVDGLPGMPFPTLYKKCAPVSCEPWERSHVPRMLPMGRLVVRESGSMIRAASRRPAFNLDQRKSGEHYTVIAHGRDAEGRTTPHSTNARCAQQ